MNTLPPKDCYVMLHVGTGPSQGGEKTSPALVIQGSEHFQLSDDIWIQKLDETLAKNVQRACEPAQYKIDNVELDRHLYAFVRIVPTDERTRYEGMDALFATAALSRLVHPTSIGGRYCARVFRFDQKDSPVQAIQYYGISADAFAGDTRDWLSLEDAKTLHSLMAWASKDKPMHARVHRAYWNHEYAARSLYLDMRWGFVVSGLEALINIGEKDSSWQFRDRVHQLAQEFKVDLSDDDLWAAYKLRSKLVHAEGFLHDLEAILPKGQHEGLYMKLESVLREVIKRCLLDEKFGDFFRDDATVAARWPLHSKP
jgi:hypothetical protein